MTKKQGRMYNAVAFLEDQITAMKKDFREKEIKHDEVLFSLEMMLKEKDRVHVRTVKEMRKLREIMLRCQHENEQLKLDLKSQQENLRRYRTEQENLDAENQDVHEVILRYLHENDQLKLDLESHMENLRIWKEKNRFEQEKLNAENQNMHEIMLRCQDENDQLKLELRSLEENLRRCDTKNKNEREKINLENQKVRESLHRCQYENDLLKLDLESQKEILRRCEDKNRIKQEKLNAESQKVNEIMLSYQYENEQLKLEVESTKENLRKCKDKNKIEQERLNSDIQNLHELICQQENEQLRRLEPQKENLRRGNDKNKIEQEMQNVGNQHMHEIMLMCQEENERLKLDLESQKENYRRCNEKNRIEREKLNAEYQKGLEIMVRCKDENDELKVDLESQKEILRRCKEKNMIEQEKLIAENKKLKTRLYELEWEFALANPDGTDSTSGLKENRDAMSKELEKVADQKQDREGLNQNLVVELQMVRHELEGVHEELIGVQNRLHEKDKALITLKKELENTIDDTQAIMSVNQALLIKERISTDELHKARQQLITGLSDLLTHRTIIGIKRMGELDQKPFRDACLEKIFGEDSSIKAVELCSLWERHIRNPQWHPFIRMRRDSEFSGQEVEAVDDNDGKLKELKNVWGQHVYEAVSTALSELNDYNPSGRYPVPELWNFKEGRKSDLKEVIEYLIKQLKSFKSTAKTLKRRR